MKQLPRRSLIRSAYFICVGLVILAGITVFVRHTSERSVQHIESTANTSAALSDQLKDTTRSLKPSGQQTAPNSTMPATGTTTPSTNMPNTSATMRDGSCKLDVNERTKRFQEEVSKERLNLDAALGYPAVGSMISDQYVIDYNQSVSKLHDKYRAELEAGRCTVPVKLAPLLPATYPN